MTEFKNPLDDSLKSEAEPQSATSATGIFGTVARPQSQPAGEDVLASLNRETKAPGSGERATPPVAADASNQAANAGGQGEFTRMLQTLKAPGGSAPGAKPAQELASIFRQVSVEPPEPAETPAKPFAAAEKATQSAAGPGTGEGGAMPSTFTQMFSALSEKPAQPAETAPVSAWAPVTPPTAAQAGPASGQPFAQASGAAAGEPGEFTRLFQTVRSPAGTGATAATNPPAPAEAPRSTASISQPGIQPGSGLPSEPAAGPGSFTQLFQALNQEEARTTPPPAPMPQPAPEPAAAAGGFTQLLQSLSAQPAPSPAAGTPQARPPAAPVANFPAANFPAPNFPAPGEAAFPARPAPSGPVSAGPGEFTRVISGSAFREAQAGGMAAPPSAPAAGTGRPVIPMPVAMPPMAAPKPPAPAPHLAPPAFTFPPPAAPQAGPPPPAAPPQSALQKYLPLILLVNVFLLVVIVLILFFVLRHR